MLKKIIAITMMSPLLMFTVGCFSEGGGVEFGSSIDYLSSSIKVLGEGLANGSSFLYIEVHAKNSDGTPIANFIPEIGVSASAGSAAGPNGSGGVVVHNCNATNSEGVARCAITSTLPGVKTLTLLNVVGASVVEDAVFATPVLSKTLISNVPGSSINNTSGGYSISASLSNMKAPLKYVDSSGHTVYSTVQGIVLSEDE